MSKKQFTTERERDLYEDLKSLIEKIEFQWNFFSPKYPKQIKEKVTELKDKHNIQ